MTLLKNIIASLRAYALTLADAIVAFFSLLAVAARALLSGKGPLKERLVGALTLPSSQIKVFAVLRAVLPNFFIAKQLITSYENNGTAFVTRATDVIEVLDREEDFAVVYEPKMRAITGGPNFFLGMQNTAQYQHDTSLMKLAMRRDDVETLVTPLARARAEAYASAFPTRIDVPQELTLRVPSAIVAEYFGVSAQAETDAIHWATSLFWWLFVDLKGDPAIETKALMAAAELRKAIDAAIAARKASGETKDDVLGRALDLQKGAPEFDDLAIRNNLIGLVIGAIPTISKASVQALDQLLDRPEALAGAHAAAKAGDEALLGAYLFEALRFNPVNPVIYRRANRSTVIAANTFRARKIPEGAMVLAANLSAMFDPLKIEKPNEFRVDRPWGEYILWGYGLHTCFGAYINRAVIPAILRPVLARPNLRRAAGTAGQIDGGGTPFPQHFVVESD
ncbi:cytochrome P450 [Methylosinus sporium]|uniref:Cytochrome P450 n=1 Tax=Methylosinus sporium TaxID=428 RepID=A0A2U1SU17_METSR|nr:cytochrome P450 [Methylosinus sporium]PWB95100.1 cytochrome P450 [Methylosinus sporium]